MAADPKLSWDGVKAAMDGLGDSLNSGYLRIYDNTTSIPANADDSNSTNVLLAELTLAADAFGACSGAGVITAGTIGSEDSALATGTASYGRYYKSDGTTCIFQGTCGTSSADFILNSTSIQSGASVSCSSATITMVRE